MDSSSVKSEATEKAVSGVVLHVPGARRIGLVRMLGLVAAGLAFVGLLVFLVSLFLVIGSALADQEPAWCEAQHPGSTSSLELCVAPGESRRWTLTLGTTVMSKAGVPNWASPTGVTCVWRDSTGKPTVTSRIRSRVDDERYSEGVISITGDAADLRIGGEFTVPPVALKENEVVTMNGMCTGTVYYPEPQTEPRPHFKERRVDLAVPAQLHVAEKYRYPSTGYGKIALLAFAGFVVFGLCWVRLAFPKEAKVSK